MPWSALTFAEREAKSKLSELFKVEGIPTFVGLWRSLPTPISRL